MRIYVAGVIIISILLMLPQTFCLTCILRPEVIIWYTNVNVDTLVNISPGMALIDLDEVDSDDVEKLHKAGVIILAYISLGTAEEWREYWRSEWLLDPPSWMGPPLPGWPGEYMVEFWSLEWLSIVRVRLEEAGVKGFDGVILDNVDVYQMLGEPGEKALRALRWIRENYDGLIYVNIGGALELLYLDELGEYVDGVLREEVWFTYGGRRVPEQETSQAVRALSYFMENGGDVIVLDYGGRKAAETLEEYCIEYGFKCFVGERELDHIPSYIMAGCVDPALRLRHRAKLLTRFLPI